MKSNTRKLFAIIALFVLSIGVCVVQPETFSNLASAAPLYADVGSIRDNVIISNVPTSNYGTAAAFQVGELNDSASVRRALIDFALYDYDNDQLSSAVLNLKIMADYSNNARQFCVYRVKRNWVEEQSTWNVYATGVNWSTPGAYDANDIDTTPLGCETLSASESVGTWIQFDLGVDAVENAIHLGGGVLRLMVKADTEIDDGYGFHSEEAVSPSDRPYFTIVEEVAPTATDTPTNTATSTATNTPTNTATSTATYTPTNTPTATSTSPSDTPTATSTAPTDTPTETSTPTDTGTPTETSTPTDTPTPTPTGPTNTPAPIPTLFWDSSVSYGEMGITVGLTLLASMLALGGLFGLLQYYSGRKKP